MPRQHFSHLVDESGLIDFKLRFGLLFQIFLAIADVGQACAEDQILDLDFTLSPLVRPLDDGAGRIAPVGIFHLLAQAMLGISQIKLGANAGAAQRRDHFLVTRDLAAEHGDDDGAEFGFGVELAQHRECGLEPRNADGKSSRRYGLAAEARDETIIAPPATDRAETHGATFFVFGFERQFNFEDGAGVIFETANDRWINFYLVRAVTSGLKKNSHFLEFMETCAPNFGMFNK